MPDYNVDFFEVGTIDSPEWRIADRDTAHLTRAMVAQGGLWANHAYEAAYAVNYQDSDGQQLTGERAYTLTLDPPPPAAAFWSLTMYDMPDYFLVANPIDRYSIGDRTPGLVTGPNGSLTVAMSTHPPAGPGAPSNWLPAPPGPFRPVLRMYIPGRDLIEGRYHFPPIRKAPADSSARGTAGEES